MKNHRFEPNGQCYFLPAGVGFCEVLKLVRENCLGACYPERSMSRVDRMAAKPFIPSIITEEAYLVALYPREKVFVWDEEFDRWCNPDWQTYGADVSGLEQDLFKNRCSIPLRVLSDKSANEFLAAIKTRYANLK